jgi:hypothetical protein
MNESSSLQTVDNENRPARGWFRWWYILIAVILLFLLTAVVLTARAFAPWKEVPAVIPSMKAMTVQYKLMRSISKEFTRKEKVSRKAVLKLSPREIDSLFTLVANMKPKNSPYPLRYYQFKSHATGVFSVTAPIRTSMTWLWGGTVYAQIAFTVSKAPGRELKVNILSLYLTDWAMNFPKILEKLNAAAAQEVKKLKIGEMIESISFENGQFVITYDPQLMAQMLFRRKR